jgi:hypothetical protein
MACVRRLLGRIASRDLHPNAQACVSGTPVWTRLGLFATVALFALVTSISEGRSLDLSVPGQVNATPSISADGRFVALVWAATRDGRTDVHASTSRDGGRTFGSPVRVNDVTGQANVNGEQPPRVTLVPRAGREPSVVVVWTGKVAAGTRLFWSRSDDGGRSFGAAAVVPGSDGAGNRGWESIATDREGRVVAIWLDHRELASSAGAAAAGHDHAAHGTSSASAEDGVARAQLSKLYFARLDAAGSARALTGGVCYCCKTSLVVGADGAMAVAWRHVYPGQMRDIAFTISRDGGRSFSLPVRVSEDRWSIDGCPENGPAATLDAEGAVHVVWPTLVAGSRPGSEGTPALFYAMSRDGRSFGPRRRLPTEGTPRHPQIAFGPNGSVVITWDEGEAGLRRVVTATGVSDGGAPRLSRRVLSATGLATYPVVARADGGFVLAWTSGPAASSVIRTQRIDD